MRLISLLTATASNATLYVLNLLVKGPYCFKTIHYSFFNILKIQLTTSHKGKNKVLTLDNWEAI